MAQASISRSSLSIPSDDSDEFSHTERDIPREPERYSVDVADFDRESAGDSEPVVDDLTQKSGLSGGGTEVADATGDHAERLSWRDALPLLAALAVASWVLFITIIWATTAS